MFTQKKNRKKCSSRPQRGGKCSKIEKWKGVQGRREPKDKVQNEENERKTPWRTKQKRKSEMEKEGRKIPSPSLRIGIVRNLCLNHGITHWDQKSREITSASPSQVTPSPALLAMRIGVDRQCKVLAEGIETGALE